MRIYDISQEVFGGAVYPGDTRPEKDEAQSIRRGDACNLTDIRMCAHNGTHIDAPYHFFDEGKTVEQLEPERFIGPAYVAEHTGELFAADAERVLKAARARDARSAERILIKGNAVVTADAARVIAREGVKLFGNEAQTVGPEDAPAEVHRILLGAGTVLLEGIRLSGVPEGVYLLHAAPLKLGGCDGAPCRATLMDGIEVSD